MILASGARGRGFDSPLSPSYLCFFWTPNKSHKPPGALHHLWAPLGGLSDAPDLPRQPPRASGAVPPVRAARCSPPPALLQSSACGSKRPVAAVPCGWARQGCRPPGRHPTAPKLRGGSAPPAPTPPLKHLLPGTAAQLSPHLLPTTLQKLLLRRPSRPATSRPAAGGANRRLRAAPPPGGGGGNGPRQRRRGGRRPSACRSICCQP